MVYSVCCRETWEKVNLAFHPNNTVSYEPTKKFRFSRELSAGDESDIIFTLNIPLMVSNGVTTYTQEATLIGLPVFFVASRSAVGGESAEMGWQVFATGPELYAQRAESGDIWCAHRQRDAVGLQ